MQGEIRRVAKYKGSAGLCFFQILHITIKWDHPFFYLDGDGIALGKKIQHKNSPSSSLELGLFLI